MADTTALAPTWLQTLQIPSIGQVLVILATALVSIGGTLATQWMAAPRMEIAAADKAAPLPLQRQIDAAVNRLDGRITEALGTVSLCVDEIQQLRSDFRTPRSASKPKTVTTK